MRSDIGPEAERAATALGLDELLALRPRRLTGPFPPGRRGPGGERAGRGHARSLNFEAISPYAPGDDVRAIDWRASARSGATQMRRFAAESHRARMIVLDLRPDLYFGLRDRLMAKTAALAAARLAWEAAALQEPVGLIVGADRPAPPRRGRRALVRLLETIEAAYRAAASAGAPAEAMDGLMNEAAAMVSAGDEVHVVSDFEDASAAWEDAARRLAARAAATAWVVEDRAFAAPAPPGRFPMIDRLGARFSVAVGRKEGAGAPAAAKRRRAALRARLRDAGWAVRSASDILPSAPERGR